jgi:hypothetical protein
VIVGQVMPLSIDSPELAPQWAQFGGAFGRWMVWMDVMIVLCHVNFPTLFPFFFFFPS